MYKGLIDNLGFVYTYLSKARGILSGDEMRGVAKGAHTMTSHAAAVLGCGKEETREDKGDLKEIELMDRHIEEMAQMQLLINQEIV